MNAFDNFAFILLRPKSPGNMGAAARALKNMGFSDLRFVAPETRDRLPEVVMAVHADDIYQAAQTFPDLDSALSDCSIAIGTTAHSGPYRRAARPLHEVASELGGLSAANRIAIVFGPEDFGLANEDLKHCQRLITIPADPHYSSINLAQAVMLTAYELRMTLISQPMECARQEFAPVGAVQAMLARMAEALLTIGFLSKDNPDHIMFTIGEIFGRSGLRPREVDIFNGIARQLRWFAEGGHKILAAKGSRIDPSR